MNEIFTVQEYKVLFSLFCVGRKQMWMIYISFLKLWNTNFAIALGRGRGRGRPPNYSVLHFLLRCSNCGTS
jgi:hypothetical protein